MEIEWKNQHCGVHKARLDEAVRLMPDLKDLFYSLPDNPDNFTWDVKVHMLMPGQFPCIPNWHYDNVPRVNNVQDWDKVTPDLPMWLWVSGNPLTEFRRNNKTWFIEPKKWYRFTQCDEHRGTMSNEFTWRGFVRATHIGIMTPEKPGKDCLRRHSQVYLDAANFRW